MANKYQKKGLVNYPAHELVDLVLKFQEANDNLRKEVKESKAKQIQELKSKIKELKKVNAKQEAFIKSIGETLEQYKHLIKKDGE